MNLKLILSLALFGFISTSFCSFQEKKSDSVQFFTGSFDNAIRLAKKQNRPLMIEFGTSWCGPCKKMDTETFRDAMLANYLNNNYIVYKVDAESFDGMEIAERFGVKSYPTFVFLNSRGRYVDTWKGFLSASVFLEKLQTTAIQNAYRYVQNTAKQ